MSETTVEDPDPAVLQEVALEMVDLAPEGWTDLLMIVWYEAEDVYSSRMWVEGPDVPRHRVQTGDAIFELNTMRDRQIAAGQDAWHRCDVRVTRAPGSDEPDFSVDFAYEVGDVPR